MASKKNSELFDGAFDAAVEEKPVERKPIQGRRDTLASRSNTLAKITSGDLVNRAQQRVDPARCKLWEHHNRRYELLNEHRCADLIEGIKAQGGQEFPAIVRSVKNDPNYDFEVICGARRHWTINWLREHHYDYKFLVEVRDLSDEEAFRLADIENRNRDDISDYERAVDYKNALKRYYRTQTEMADRLEVKLPWLSRYLDLADLPQAVVDCYRDVTEIKAGHVKELKPLLKDRKVKDKVLSEAKAIKARRLAGEGDPEGAQIVKLLKAATKPGNSRKTPKAQERRKTANPLVEVRQSSSRSLTLTVSLAEEASQEELVAAFKSVIAEHRGKGKIVN